MEGCSPKFEGSLGNSVAIAANKASKIWTFLLVFGEGSKTEDDIFELPITVGHDEGGNDASIVTDARGGPFRILQGEKSDFLTIGSRSEGFGGNGWFGCFDHGGSG